MVQGVGFRVSGFGDRVMGVTPGGGGRRPAPHPAADSSKVNYSGLPKVNYLGSSEVNYKILVAG